MIHTVDGFDDAAVAAAWAAAGDGDVIVFPLGRYDLAQPLPTIVDRLVTIRGEGWACPWTSPFGANEFTGAARNEIRGTVIHYTGPGPWLDVAGRPGRTRITVERLALIGPGTVGTVGMRIGSPTASAATRPHLADVLVANFDVGLDLSAQGGRFDTLALYACGVGVRLVNACGANTFADVEITGCDLPIDAYDAGQNRWVGGVIQGNTGPSTVVLRAAGNTFVGTYFENPGALTLAAPGADRTAFVACHWSGEPVRIEANDCQIIGPDGIGPVTVTGGGAVLVGQFPAGVTGPGTPNLLAAAGATARFGGRDLRLDSGRRLLLESVGSGGSIARWSANGDTIVSSATDGVQLSLGGKRWRLTVTPQGTLQTVQA
jgi:hypothetical protein